MVYYKRREKPPVYRKVYLYIWRSFVMSAILAWLSAVLSPLLPEEIYSRLDFLYNGTIICLGAGVILMLLAVVFMIAAVRRSKRRALNA